MLIPQKKYLYYICIAECKSWPENNLNPPDVLQNS